MQAWRSTVPTAIITAMNSSWPDAPHQRCEAHFLNNLSDAVLPLDTKLRQQLKTDLDGLPKVPLSSERPQDPTQQKQPDNNSPFFQQSPICHETQS